MLNEIMEFEEYTIRSNRGRIMERNYSNYYSGIERQLTIIARKIFFDYSEALVKMDDNSSDSAGIDARIEAVKDVLRLWCGFDRNPELVEKLTKLEPELAALESGYRHYVEQVLIPEATAKNKAKLQKKADEFEAEKSKSYEGRVFAYINYKPGEMINDYKRLTFEKVIANAIDEGPLRVGYLAIKKDASSVLKRKWGTKMVEIKDKAYKAVLKSLAIYLIERGDSDREYVLMNKTDLSNWSLTDARTVGPLIESIKCIMGENSDGDAEEHKASLGSFLNLGSTSLSAGNNITKLRFNSEWIRYAAPQIIWDRNAEDAEYLRMPKAVKNFVAEHPDYDVYFDNGVEALKKITK